MVLLFVDVGKEERRNQSQSSLERNQYHDASSYSLEYIFPPI